MLHMPPSPYLAILVSDAHNGKPSQMFDLISLLFHDFLLGIVRLQ